MGAGTDQAAGSGADLGRSRSRDSCQEPGRRRSIPAGDSTPTSPAPTQLRPQDAPHTQQGPGSQPPSPGWAYTNLGKSTAKPRGSGARTGSPDGQASVLFPWGKRRVLSLWWSPSSACTRPFLVPRRMQGRRWERQEPLGLLGLRGPPGVRAPREPCPLCPLGVVLGCAAWRLEPRTVSRPYSCIPRGLPAQPLARRAAQTGALGPPNAPVHPWARAPPLLTTPTRGREGRRAAVLTGSPMLLLAPGAPGEALSRWRQGPPCRATVLCPRPDASASPVSESPQKCNDLRGPRFSWSRGALSGRSWELEP